AQIRLRRNRCPHPQPVDWLCSMPALYLTEDDVVWLGDMPMAIEAVENAFAQLAEEKAVNVPRVRVAAPGVMLHSMCASAEYLGYVGWKAYTTTRRGARFHVAL